jgi:hypothetical protein
MSKVNQNAKAIAQRHNARSVAGLTLRNAAGDIDTASLGYQISMDNLTYIRKEVVKQSFYEVPPADYVPIVVGEGAFSASILTNMQVSMSGDFEQGIINQGLENDKLNNVAAGVVSTTAKVVTWAKGVGYSLVELEQALQSMNWDYIQALHEARAENWQLGIQKIAFLGSAYDTGVLGLLTQSTVTPNTSIFSGITSISSMTAAQFATFVATLLAAYQSNCNYTRMPTHFVIPQDDYVGLATPVSSTYPNVSMLTYLKDAFDKIVPGGIKILPSAYGIPANNSIGNHRYCLYRYDPKTIRMDIPVDLTVTQPGTLNNFQFQDVAYGQFTGVKAYKPLEILYVDTAA